ncbi:hypothetical protein MXD81_20335, partial [Microbacteriaceae bacterium K1510]|nr:hypothetical protein [Microbacteriaceae bacterium K1510]
LPMLQRGNRSWRQALSDGYQHWRALRDCEAIDGSQHSRAARLYDRHVVQQRRVAAMTVPASIAHTVQQTQVWLKELRDNSDLADEAAALSVL